GGGKPLVRQVVGEAEAERQGLGLGPLFEQGQDEPPGRGLQPEIGVLHPLGDGVQRDELAQRRIAGDERPRLIVRDRSEDRHALILPLTAQPYTAWWARMMSVTSASTLSVVGQRPAPRPLQVQTRPSSP